MDEEQWNSLINRYFECPGKPGVYVLGCFAANVTLYTQQVRAFNLITGLHNTQRLKPGDVIGVIGAGAAGLSAAAAAAHLGHEVHIFERAEGPLELQLNNRQRWIHPYIYNWPAKMPSDKEANLPLLSWEAAYAERVAEQIIEGWDVLKHGIREHYNVPDISISDGDPDGRRLSISRQDEPGSNYEFDHIIVAIGFGIEQGHHCQSYWAEDDFDFGFNRQNETWLISGLGDGALTDLMRLCIKRFRHEEIIGLFNSTEGIENLIEDLTKLERKIGAKAPNVRDEALSKQFREIVDKHDVSRMLDKYFRSSGPAVMLAGKKDAIFGRKSSALNRLIVAILAASKRFKFHLGEVESVTANGSRYDVKFKGQNGTLPFNRVILRHGPPKDFVASLIDAEFEVEKLREAWEKRNEPDHSVEPQWERGKTFGPETKPSRTVTSQANEKVLVSGVRLRSLTFQQDVKGDGSSIITYILDGLSVIKGGKPISRVHIRFRSASGMFGTPSLDQESLRQGFVWEPIEISLDERILDPVDRAAARHRIVGGTVRFPKPLMPGDPAIALSLYAFALNSDALSDWEMEHLYQPEDAHDLDGTPLVNPVRDYTARIMYFPVDTLTTRINLPQLPGLGPPEFSFFRRASHDRGDNVRTLVKDGTVYLTPPPDSGDWSSSAKWVRQDFGSLGASAIISRSGPYSAELRISDPRLGDAFSVSWRVSNGPTDQTFEKIVRSAKNLRDDLVAYGGFRRNAGVPAKLAFDRVSQLLIGAHAELSLAQQKLSKPQAFELGLMTLNHDTNRLEYIDCVGGDGKLLDELPKFSLPFGVGLSGACFKRPDRVYIHHPEHPPQDGWPDYYLTVEGRQQHKSIISIGLDHPQWFQGFADKGYERSRQCIAVLDIGTRTEAPWFRAIAKADPIHLQELMEIAQQFSDRIASALGY